MTFRFRVSFAAGRRARFLSPAFSLIEFLVVLGLIGGMLWLGVRAPFSAGRSSALRSGQAVLAGLVQAGRTKALVTGQSTRLLFHYDPLSGRQPPAFLSCVILQTQGSGGWETLTETNLPEGVYILPGAFTSLPAGLFAPSTGVPWTKTDGSDLRSTALRATQIVTEAVGNSPPERYAALVLSAFGSTVQSGDLVLATGRRRAPGSFLPGESPIELSDPGSVRGLTLSAYGVPAMIGSRTSF